ncbi:hypothetical protein [Paenibacillus sp. 1A_MP2]|uniref:hypothetical protein n=1 Tax=Paenibacillus sp. 1A_MP2 TaxID=3457495 RepID=UPI003FCE598F
MARRSKPLVTQFFNRDRLAFTAMNKVGHVSSDHLRSCGLADRRIQNLIRDGLIEKVAYKRKGKAIIVLSLASLDVKVPLAYGLWVVHTMLKALFMI